MWQSRLVLTRSLTLKSPRSHSFKEIEHAGDVVGNANEKIETAGEEGERVEEASRQEDGGDVDINIA